MTSRLHAWFRHGWFRREPWVGIDTERGDVPGWVLVTLMTAGLVVAIWALAGPMLEAAFEQAIASVTGE